MEYKKAAKQADVMMVRLTRTEDGVILVLAAEDGSPYAVIQFWLEA